MEEEVEVEVEVAVEVGVEVEVAEEVAVEVEVEVEVAEVEEEEAVAAAAEVAAVVVAHSRRPSRPCPCRRRGGAAPDRDQVVAGGTARREGTSRVQVRPGLPAVGGWVVSVGGVKLIVDLSPLRVAAADEVDPPAERAGCRRVDVGRQNALFVHVSAAMS